MQIGGSILQLLATKEEIQFILVREDAHSNGSIVVSNRFYDWRPVLMSGNCSHKVSLELMGIGELIYLIIMQNSRYFVHVFINRLIFNLINSVGPEHKVPIGILNLRISILPSLQEQLSDATFSAQRNMEKNRQDEKDRLFLVYTKQWGREYMDIRPEHQRRLVKIFSYDENTVSR